MRGGVRNCHRRRTSRRAGHFRTTRQPRPQWEPWQLRNRLFLLAVLEASGCADCGEDDPVVLEFDHRRDKRGRIASLVHVAGLQRLADEVAKCDVRCVNCHRLRTLATSGNERHTGIDFAA